MRTRNTRNLVSRLFNVFAEFGKQLTKCRQQFVVIHFGLPGINQGQVDFGLVFRPGLGEQIAVQAIQFTHDTLDAVAYGCLSVLSG